MYKRTPGGVPRVSREFTQWGPIYSLSFEPGATLAEIYTAFTDILGTVGDITVSGRYGTSDVAYLALSSTTITFKNITTGITRFIATKDSTATIDKRLSLSFTT
jgi:hypothetical protein